MFHLFSRVDRRGLIAALAIPFAIGWSVLPGVLPAVAATQDVASQVAIDTEAKTASVAGFRSARFGMDEEAVRQAIAKDFGKDGDEITESMNTVERTKLLTVLVPDLLEDGGMAQLSYIFGYESKTLIQVGASWSKATDPEITDADLVANGDVLSSYFANAGFAPDTITAGTAVDNGILLFRGLDGEGRAAILLLQGVFEDDGTGQNVLKPVGLALLYSVNPDDPDIFRVKNGAF